MLAVKKVTVSGWICAYYCVVDNSGWKNTVMNFDSTHHNVYSYPPNMPVCHGKCLITLASADHYFVTCCSNKV